MTQYEVYVFILCLIVFILLTTLSIVCITLITKMYLRLVRGGLEDEKLIIEHEKERIRKANKFSKAVDIAIAVFLCAILIFMFSGSIYINCTQNVYFDNVPTYRVVKTGSMAKKNKKNTYLVENGLDNQIQTFDLIATYKIPKEEDLKLYDIVVYEYDDMLIVHRIVGIEEPNEFHEERLFFLQGDAVDGRDKAPVTYAQMQGVYRGEKIPHVGSFILFLQSPIGYICVLGALLVMIITPFLDRKVEKAEEKRLQEILSARRQTQNTENHGDIGAPIVYYPVFYPVQTPVSSINDRGQDKKNE